MSLVLFVIVMIKCTAAECNVVPLQPGITYPTEQQCQSAMKRKMTSLQNIASREPPSYRGEIVCALYAVPKLRMVEKFDPEVGG